MPKSQQLTEPPAWGSVLSCLSGPLTQPGANLPRDHLDQSHPLPRGCLPFSCGPWARPRPLRLPVPGPCFLPHALRSSSQLFTRAIWVLGLLVENHRRKILITRSARVQATHLTGGVNETQRGLAKGTQLMGRTHGRGSSWGLYAALVVPGPHSFGHWPLFPLSGPQVPHL